MDGGLRGYDFARNPGGLSNNTEYGAGEFPLPTRPPAGAGTQSTSKPPSMFRSQQTEESYPDLSKLSPVQILMYLKSNLTSHASKIILNPEITQSKFEVALQMLEQRYQNNRVILWKLRSRIHGFSAVQTESASQLDQLHSVFNETSQSIKALERSVKNDLRHFLIKNLIVNSEGMENC